MAYFMKRMEKEEKELLSSTIKAKTVVVPPFNHGNSPVHKDSDKRVRREIANSNERRRMQSINAGFQSLKTLIPHSDGEKLSKAAILQQTAEHITRMEQEKTQILRENIQLKRLVARYERGEIDSPSPKKRKRYDSMTDEGIGSPESEDASATIDDLRREMLELRCQLDRERRFRLLLEDQNRGLESQLYPEKLKELTKQVHSRGTYQNSELSILQQVPMGLPVMSAPMSTTSQQNLDTIVKAIRHLEGDQGTPGNTPIQTPTPDQQQGSESETESEQEEHLYSSNAGSNVKVEVIEPVPAPYQTFQYSRPGIYVS
ncbi:transcription factor AP-4-like isoform X2 [Anneissia japonica]|uniref:transcription factor AP-4-like isoform X2 n=1 Tax=Anneissia japonica TaxID=1529436 RepID=UPI0014259011|nr:transcription factor AP-4-like isoform X2 [Anneissia japonica]